MPTIGLSSSGRKSAAHHRQGSGELGIFEATKYFSGAIDGFGFGFGAGRAAKEERVVRDSPQQPQSQSRVGRHSKEKKSSCKQPSSPAARLASFLNSLFSQTAASKRRPKSTPATPTTKTSRPVKDVDEAISGLGAGRKRRSRMGHSQSIRSSIYSSTSGFGSTPPLHPNTPAAKSALSFCPRNEVWEDRRVTDVGLWAVRDNRHMIMISSEERNRALERVNRIYGRDGFVGNKWVLNKGSCGDNYYGFVRKEREWVGGEFVSLRGRKSFRRKREEYWEDDGGSDASSDLFELKNIELAVGDGLPVYGTTRVHGEKY